MGVGSVRGRRPRSGSGPRGEPRGDPARSCSLEEERLRVDCLCAAEEAAYAAGFRAIAGVDEVGRGCLAGPVYAGAVMLTRRVPLSGLDDSKLLPDDVRDSVARRVIATAVGVGLGAATPAEIDGLGIVEATFLAMRRALAVLEKACGVPDLIMIDAFRIPALAIPQRAYIHGDARVASIAAASVVAKCARDRFMETLDAEYPHYGFASHRGYATPEHIAALDRHGPSPVHRLSFDRVVPVRRPAALSRAPLLRDTVPAENGTRA
jgi:ribonuclease HII